MRNDGTNEQPIWVCNNPKCVCYVPEPQPELEPEFEQTTTEQTEETAGETAE